MRSKWLANTRARCLKLSSPERLHVMEVVLEDLTSGSSERVRPSR